MKSEKNKFSNLTLSEIAKENYHYAEVFEKHNLDFCCNGNINFLKACETNNIDVATLTNELEKAVEDKNKKESFDEWALDFLIDYIINNHHAYIVENIPLIAEQLKKICEKHGEKHSELFDINENFTIVYKDLQHHMIKEEKILFPYIKHMVLVFEGKAKKEAPYFGTVENPIRMMEEEHKNAGDLFKKIRELSNNYTVPADGCATFNLTINKLKDFEEDLHKHIHLENNILFPKSIAMEKELFAN